VQLDFVGRNGAHVISLVPFAAGVIRIIAPWR